MVSDTPTRWKSGSVVGVNERQYKAEICGHYVFNHLEIKQIREKLNKAFDCDGECRRAVKSLISGYLKDFGWEI
ncbi:MAG: hypothetical protein Q7K54_03125, partial [Candidatus Parcubacteria bacterium]|nr:hypothetical protein [Candidatus Parcubacteria bacterium]